VFVLGLAGSLARQKPVAVTEGTLRADRPMFVALASGQPFAWRSPAGGRPAVS
jgi:K+-transporting ATPase ATPase A chain